MEMPATAHLTAVAPDNEKFTVQSRPARLPSRKPNAEYRSREHLTEREVERLIKAVKDNRWGHRDATMVLTAFRHGLRASELVDLCWDQVDLEHALLHVRRLKNGSPATHPLTGKELRALRRLQREQDTKSLSVFTSERGTPFSRRGFQAMLKRAGEAAGFDMKIHPHMLRHACGFKLANDGVDTRTIQAISATSRSSMRCVTPSWRRPGSKAFLGLTAPAASFEATVGGSAARGSSNFSRKSR
jgi:integrase